MKIRLRITLLIVTLTIFSIGAVGGTIFAMSWRAASRLASQYSESRASQSAEKLSGFLGQFWRAAEVTAAMMGQFELIPESARRAYLDNMLRTLLLSDSEIVATWSVWNSDVLEGDDLANAGAPGTNAQGRFVPGHYRSEGGAITTFLMQGFQDVGFYLLPTEAARIVTSSLQPRALGQSVRNIAVISAPVRNAVGEIVGVVGIDTEITQLHSIIQGSQTPFPGALTMVLSNDGTIVSHPDLALLLRDIRSIAGASAEIGISSQNLDNFLSAVYGGERYGFRGTMGARDFQFHAFPAFFGDGSAPWSMVLGIPLNEIHAENYAMAAIAGMIFLAAIALALTVAMLASKNLSRPIVGIARGLRSIALGEGDIRARLPETGADELAEVSRYFNQAIGRIGEMVNELTAMKDSLKIGLFFIDRNSVIQDHYSRFLGVLLEGNDLKGKRFTDLLAASVSPRELETFKDYLGMLFDRTFGADILREINPLDELRYVYPSGLKKIFHCEFLKVVFGQKKSLVLVTIYDITAKVELQEQLRKEEKKRQNEMANFFEVLQVNNAMFKAFEEDVQHEFECIDNFLGDAKMTDQDMLRNVYQSIHAIKSNAVTLGLGNFAAKAHDVESLIKKLRNHIGEIPFDNKLALTMEIERLAKEHKGFRLIVDKANALKFVKEESSGKDMLVTLLEKTAKKTAESLGKKIMFVAKNVDQKALEKGPRQMIKKILMQLVRNSVAHGIESPAQRIALGKDDAGIIRLSIFEEGETIQVKLGDDGRGLDYKKIAEKALEKNLIKPEDATNKGLLLKAMFSPGFSTAEDENVHAGQGIGLNLVQDLAQQANGTLKLQTASGKGTIFSIAFPAKFSAA